MLYSTCYRCSHITAYVTQVMIKAVDGQRFRIYLLGAHVYKTLTKMHECIFSIEALKSMITDDEMINAL